MSRINWKEREQKCQGATFKSYTRGPSHLSSAVGASRSAACAGGGMSEKVRDGGGAVCAGGGLVQLGLFGASGRVTVSF